MKRQLVKLQLVETCKRVSSSSSLFLSAMIDFLQCSKCQQLSSFLHRFEGLSCCGMLQRDGRVTSLSATSARLLLCHWRRLKIELLLGCTWRSILSSRSAHRAGCCC